MITGLKKVYLTRAAIMEAKVAKARIQSTVSLETGWMDEDCVQGRKVVVLMQASGYITQGMCTQRQELAGLENGASARCRYSQRPCHAETCKEERSRHLLQ